MGIKLDPQYLKRYREIAGLLMNYGNSDLVKNAGLEEALRDDKTSPGKSKRPPKNWLLTWKGLDLRM